MSRYYSVLVITVVIITVVVINGLHCIFHEKDAPKEFRVTAFKISQDRNARQFSVKLLPFSLSSNYY